MSKSRSERVAQEKEWHNKTYGTDVRASTQKFYSVLKKDGGVTGYRNELVEKVLSPDSSVLLDYGCGDGSFLLSMADKCKEGYGIDISDSRIEGATKEAKERNITNVEFSVMDAMNTTFEDGKFDVVVGNAILHHLDLEASITEIARIIKKGGAAYFIEPLATNPIINLYRALTPKKRTADEQPFRRKEIKLIKSILPGTEIEYFAGLSLLAFPFKKCKSFPKIAAFLERADRKWFLAKKSPFRCFAWVCFLTLKY
ncbi:MAG: class I SAM-dependent methyltransferase [Clostridia bacterium]|nr:class I SAM-dependent methyltransferase [Clostridia bacterium]